MNIVVFFTEAGAPVTDLTPTIDVWALDGTHTIDKQDMVEVDGGFYYYDFATYDESVDYCIRADGGNKLSDNDRYLFSTNEVGQVTANQTSAATTLSYILGLSQSNMRIINPAYNDDNLLTAATVKIYPTAANAEMDTSPLKEYTVTATYNSSREMTSYLVKEV